MYITYRFKDGTSGNYIRVTRELDGAATPAQTSGLFKISSSLAGSTGWNVVHLVPASTIECESISFRIATSNSNGDDATGFLEINDISIEYRPKRKRAT